MSLLARVKDSPPILFEGAMGTMLMTRGLPAGKPGDLFNITNPRIVREVHAGYVEAGCRVLVSNTFNGNRLRMAQCGIEEHFKSSLQSAVRSARQAAGDDLFVAGSIGPTGLLMPPAGDLDPRRAEDVFAEQAQILDRAGVDLILVETMFDVAEALAAVRACRRVARLPIAATMTYSRTPRGFFTVMGNSAADSLKQLLDAGATIVGANCTLDPDEMRQLAEQVRDQIDAPLLFKPNAGQPQVRKTGLKYPSTAKKFAASAVRMARIGVECIGGCCGTTPEYLLAARESLVELARA